MRAVRLLLVSSSLCTAVTALAGCGAPKTTSGPSISLPSSGFAADTTTHKIYVVNFYDDEVTTYLDNGKPTSPIISTPTHPYGIDVDVNGKIYVTSFIPGSSSNTLTTYTPDGVPTTPTITTDLCGPTGVAVDKHFNIWVSNACGAVTIYNSDGEEIKKITDGLSSCQNIWIDATANKVYVTNWASSVYMVATYTLDGTRTKPTITQGLEAPNGVVSDDSTGDIYVANYYGANITTYDASGNEIQPTIRANVSGPDGLALDSQQKLLYVANTGSNTLTTYRLNGRQTAPTISGLGSPRGIAYH